jgi:hypothetical protein
MGKRKLFIKIFTLLLLFTTILGTMSGSIYAQNKISTVKINEYQVLKDANEEYNELKKNGSLTDSKFADYSKDSIYVIENYKEVYTEKIKDLQSKSIEVLKNFNYNNSQIEAIKSFDGSEEMMMLAASTCTVTGGYRNYTHGSNGTTIKLIAEFRWEGLSPNWFSDIFPVAWSSPMKVDSSVGYVKYKDTYGLNPKTFTHSPKAGGLYMSYMVFDKSKNIDQKGYYVSDGSMIIELSASTDEVDIAGFADYGYTYISITPTVSFDGMSFSFSKGTTSMDTDRFYSN